MIKFDDEDILHDTGYIHSDRLHIEIKYYDATLDCESEICAAFTKNDVIKMAKFFNLEVKDLET